MTEIKQGSLDFILIEDGEMIVMQDSEKKYAIKENFYVERDGKIHRYEVIGYDKSGFPVGIRL